MIIRLNKHTKDGVLDTESLAKEINTEFPKHAVPKAEFNTINELLKTANSTITDLKKDNGDNETLQATKNGKWGTQNGIETIISQNASANSKRLAELVQAELVKEHKRTNRGLMTDIAQSGINIAVLRHTNMPAILIESGFMDNLEEAKTMLDPEFQKADAEATCRGICKFFGVTYVPEKEEKDVIYRVQVGAYNNQNNANKARERLKMLGYNAIVVASKR